jgi:hypothetical protein
MFDKNRFLVSQKKIKELISGLVNNAGIRQRLKFEQNQQKKNY